MQLKRCAKTLGVILVLLTLALQLRAQSGNEGAIGGTVTDQSGAVVPGAKLTITNKETRISYETTSNSDGLYEFPVVAVGTYTLVAEHSGFATLSLYDIALAVGSHLNVPVAMGLASQTTSVKVTAAAPVIEVTQSQISSTVNERSVESLPTLGRNFINFVLLTPGVTTDERSGDISFAGQRGTLNSLVVDGADNNNTFFGQTLGRTGSGRAPYQFSQDAVAEFRVNSNAYSAEYGHAGGAVVNVITKSGTNNFHGTAFEFYRDRSLNANDLINKTHGRPKSPYHFNQFGGDLGGPIVKDKAFFFFDYDGQRNIFPNFTFLNLPRGFTPTDAFQLSALAYLAARANPWSQTFNQNVYLGKVDWQISPQNHLAVRYDAQRFSGNNLENGGSQNSIEHTGASNVTTDTLTFDLTSTFTPMLVNVARFSYLRDNEPGQANSMNPQATIFQGGQQVFTVGRNFFSPRFTNIKRGEWADTLTWVHGRHTLKTGANILHDGIANFFPGNFSGQYTFNSLDSFGANLAGTPAPAAGDNFVQAFAGSGTSGPTTHPNLFEFSGFVQDEWRSRKDLTLNLGLRYDIDKLAQPTVLNPSPALAAMGIKTNFVNTDDNNFGPRVGFAWTPGQSQKLVVRGGYGIYYGRTPSILLGTAHSNNGLNVQTLTFTGSSIPQYPNTQCGPPTASPSCAAPTGGTSGSPIIFVFAKDYVQPYVQQGSLGAEWQFSNNMSLSINYLHVQGTHLTRTRDINLAGPETATNIGIAGTNTVLTYNKFTLPRPIAGFFRVEMFESNSNSTYDGLTVALKRRFSQNFQFLASYTLGKVVDDGPDSTSVVPFSFDDAKMVQDPLNIRADRAAGVNDQRHRFVLSGVWNLDYARNFSAVPKAILGGWQFSGIFTAQSGQPYSGVVNFDLNGDSNSRTDRTPGLGRDTFYLPRTISLDPRLTRNFGITEKIKLELIAEGFNIFNRANINSVNNTQYSRSISAAVCGVAGTPCLVPQSLFGSPLGTVGPRILQLAAKIVF